MSPIWVVLGEHGKPIWVKYDENGDVEALIGEAVDELANAVVMSAAEYNTHALLNNLTPVDPHDVKSVLLKENGQTVTSADEIGWHYAFFVPPGDTDVLSAEGRDSLNGYPGPGQDYRLLKPIKGATVSMGPNVSTSTNEDGFYILWYYTPFCVGTGVNTRDILTLKVYTGYSGQLLTRPRSYTISYPILHFCSGESALTSPTGIVGAAGKQRMYDEEVARDASRPGTKNIHVDIAELTGRAVMYNSIRPGIGMNPEIAEKAVPLAPETKYTYDKPDFTPDHFSPDTDINADGVSDTATPENGKAEVRFGDSGSGPANLTRLADYSPDMYDRGLLRQLSKDDLKNTDIYVYRNSNHQFLASQNGLGPDDETYPGDAVIRNYSVMMRGPYFFMQEYKAMTTDEWQTRADIPTELRTRPDLFRPGENLKVYVINRTTGYIGSALAKFSPRKSGGTSLVSFSAGDITMRPPNLKVRAMRKYIVKKGLTAGEERLRLIGSEGSGLADDEIIVISTEWQDWDGTPLPADLPGYTGRLARVDAPDHLLTLSGDNPGAWPIFLSAREKIHRWSAFRHMPETLRSFITIFT